uniref:Uncharacterized protein n=2 Tax=Caenorhabditis japonica TaxID=281687 RepID=A0A8R1EPZ9_CAEJA
ENSKHALNLHLCFVDKNRRGLRTNGMVQLFDRPHPTRVPLDYDPKSDSYQLQLDLFGYGMSSNISSQIPKQNIEKQSEHEENHYQIYQEIKKIRRLRHKTHFTSMVSLMEVMAQIVLAPHMSGRFDDHAHIRHCIRMFAFRIPVNFQKLFDFLLNPAQDFPEANEFAFFAAIRLNIPTTRSVLGIGMGGANCKREECRTLQK